MFHKKSQEYPEKIERIDNIKVNVYVIKLDKIVQIDAGRSQDADKIIKYYRNSGSAPDYILITAVDYLHVGGLKKLYEEFKPKIFVSKYEMDKLSNGSDFKGIMEVEGKSISYEGLKYFNTYARLNMNDFEIIYTPGYTSGNISIYYKPDNVLFTGEAVVIKRNGITIDKMFIINESQAIESMNKIKNMKPVLILPSHGKPLLLK